MRIALTFDDGPNTTTTMDVLDVLEKEGIRGSFFLIGENITEESAKSVERALRLGCSIQNHSLTHSDMTKLSKSEIEQEIKETEKRIVAITGKPSGYFRPPYILVRDEMWDAITLPFISGFGCEDWLDEVPAEERAKRVLEKAVDNCIILLHDMEGNWQTVEALKIIIPALRERGFSFVTVPELFEAQGIKEGVRGKVYSLVE